MRAGLRGARARAPGGARSVLPTRASRVEWPQGLHLATSPAALRLGFRGAPRRISPPSKKRV